MYKKRQVVYFNGTEEAKIGELLISSNGTMFIANCDPVKKLPIYIYILSDDPIKEGNWCVDKNNSVYRQITDKVFEQFTGAKKVIATNDPELHKGWIRDDDPKREYPDRVMITTMNGVPKLSDSFIQQFIHRYNIKLPIYDIMVEYGFTIDKSLGPFHQQRKYFLKVNPDNTVNTKEEQRTWTRSEVLEIARQAFNQGEMNEGDNTESYLSFDDLIEEIL